MIQIYWLYNIYSLLFSDAIYNRRLSRWSTIYPVIDSTHKKNIWTAKKCFIAVKLLEYSLNIVWTFFTLTITHNSSLYICKYLWTFLRLPGRLKWALKGSGTAPFYRLPLWVYMLLMYFGINHSILMKLGQIITQTFWMAHRLIRMFGVLRCGDERLEHSHRLSLEGEKNCA